MPPIAAWNPCARTPPADARIAAGQGRDRSARAAGSCPSLCPEIRGTRRTSHSQALRRHHQDEPGIKLGMLWGGQEYLALPASLPRRISLEPRVAGLGAPLDLPPGP